MRPLRLSLITKYNGLILSLFLSRKFECTNKFATFCQEL